jgi:hypothetical protein
MLMLTSAYCAFVPLQVIGSPSEEDIAFVSSDKARRYLRSLPPCPRADFRKLYPDADEQVRHVAFITWNASIGALRPVLSHVPCDFFAALGQH